MKGLASQPTDILSRHPAFDTIYRQHMQDLVEHYDAQLPDGSPGLSNELIDSFGKQAREHSLGEMNKLLIDISRYSNAAHMFRFVAPFFGAWQESLSRWARIFIENPEQARKANMMWNAPNRSGLVVDENGDRVPPHSPLKDSYAIQFQVPRVWQKRLGLPEEASNIRISKNSFNLSLQGDPPWLPGFGPLVQLPVNEIVKRHPEYADAVSYILPFGPKSNSLDLLKSSTMLRAQSLGNADDDAHKAATVMIMNGILTDARLGKRAMPPNMAALLKEANDKSGKLGMIRLFSAMGLPVQPRYQSPYQFYIDQYHKLRAADYKTADEKFYEKYPDYFAFATSVTKNNTGLPATIAAVKAQRKYADLIAANPALAGVIVGPEAGGQFSSAAYYHQLMTPVGPGSDVKDRERRSPEEVYKDNQAKQGWIEYMKVMNQIEAVRISRGIPSLQSAGGEDLADLKRQWVAK